MSEEIKKETQNAELNLEDLDHVAGGAGGSNPVTLQALIDTLKVFPGIETLHNWISQSKLYAKEQCIELVPRYMVARGWYPGFSEDEIRNYTRGMMLKAINSVA